MGYMWDGMGWMMLFGGIWMILFWGGLATLIIWGISRLTRQGKQGQTQHPLDVAKERYARGEISREEFEQIKKDLS